MKKDTGALLEELGLSPDFKTYYEKNCEYYTDKDLSVVLNELLRKKGVRKSEAIKNSELSADYAYQIFSGRKKPERDKLLALAVGMRLDPDEVQQLLKCASYPTLYVKKTFDSIVFYGICKKMSVLEINELLYQYGERTIG